MLQRGDRHTDAGLVAGSVVALGEQLLHERRHLFHHCGIGLVLELPAARAGHGVGGEEGRLWIAILQVLGDDRRVVHGRFPVDEHRNLPVRAHGQELGRLGFPEGLSRPGDLQRLVLETLLGERDAHLGAERAEDSGPQLHGRPPLGISDRSRTQRASVVVLPRPRDRARPRCRRATCRCCCTTSRGLDVAGRPVKNLLVARPADRWTAAQKADLVLQVLRGDTTRTDACRVTQSLGRGALKSTSGRISMEPSVAKGIPAPIRTASRRSRASITATPPSASLVSMNGPSVADISPSRTCTVLAVAGSWRAMADTRWPLAFNSASWGPTARRTASASGL